MQDPEITVARALANNRIRIRFKRQLVGQLAYDWNELQHQLIHFIPLKKNPDMIVWRWSKGSHLKWNPAIAF